jgi:acetyl-CoA carboxylase beta subunit
LPSLHRHTGTGIAFRAKVTEKKGILPSHTTINQPIYFYQDNTHHLFVMYLIIRCPSCRTFTYVDRFQKWKLCPVCGHAHEVVRAPAYLEVEHYLEAEHIVKQMEKHLHTTKKSDFSPEETAELRKHYTEALRKKAKGHHA